MTIFEAMQSALVNIVERELYVETDMIDGGCPDYARHLRDTIRELIDAKTMDDIVSIHYIASNALLGAETMAP
jgi:hypothetical protein